MSARHQVGNVLQPVPILADANCLLVLLAASFIYQLTGFGFIDSLGVIGLIYFSVKEGHEAFEKASGVEACGCKGGCICE